MLCINTILIEIQKTMCLPIPSRKQQHRDSSVKRNEKAHRQGMQYIERSKSVPHLRSWLLVNVEGGQNGYHPLYA